MALWLASLQHRGQCSCDAALSIPVEDLYNTPTEVAHLLCRSSQPALDPAVMSRRRLRLSGQCSLHHALLDCVVQACLHWAGLSFTSHIAGCRQTLAEACPLQPSPLEGLNAKQHAG